MNRPVTCNFDASFAPAFKDLAVHFVGYPNVSASFATIASMLESGDDNMDAGLSVLFRNLSFVFQGMKEPVFDFTPVAAHFEKTAQKLQMNMGALSEEFAELEKFFRGFGTSVAGFEDRLDEFETREVHMPDGTSMTVLNNGISNSFDRIYLKFHSKEYMAELDNRVKKTSAHTPKP